MLGRTYKLLFPTQHFYRETPKRTENSIRVRNRCHLFDYIIFNNQSSPPDLTNLISNHVEVKIALVHTLCQISLLAPNLLDLMTCDNNAKHTIVNERGRSLIKNEKTQSFYLLHKLHKYRLLYNLNV